MASTAVTRTIAAARIAPAMVAALTLIAATLFPASGRAQEQAPRQAIPETLVGRWTGDFDGMLERHRIRVLTTFSKTFYFLDKARQRGFTYELMKAFEKALNDKYKKKHLRIEVVFVPVSRDEVIPALLDGRGDIAAANLTITAERAEQVDFSDPLYWGVSELVVSAPSAQKPKTIDDLAGQTMHVRESSSYYQSLSALNERFAAEGKPEIELGWSSSTATRRSSGRRSSRT
jgi:ABC-type amino acid transport substrate-binding protein